MSEIDEADRQLKGRVSVFPMGRIKLADPTEDGKRQVEGYAAVFGNRDAYGDVIVKGAFAKTLQANPDVKVLWQHDTTKPIGKQVGGIEDEFGLRVQGELSATDLVKGEVGPLLLDGVVNGLSIGYDVVEEEFNSDLNVWLLKEIDLWEWSPVTFPANDLAKVTQVKSLRRRDLHVDNVSAHSSALAHELDGYFAKPDRRDGLDFDALSKLRGTIGGILPAASDDQGADPGEVRDKEIEFAYWRGVEDALDQLSPPT